MADVAQLGVQVTTQGADRATGELTKLAGAAARAEASTEGLTAANRGATGAASSAAQAYAQQGAAAANASKQIEMMNKAANQNRGAGGRANVGNIAAQFQDIAVTAAMSMNPLQIALQQGTQLVGVLSAMERPVAGLAQAFLALLSPLSLVTIALVAAAAAGLQLVNWSKLASSALRALADVLDEIAPYAVAAAAAMALIYAPTIIGGVISLIAWLGRLVVQLGGVAAAFLLANPALLFIAGIGAAVAAVAIFRDELTKMLGFDVVDAAKRGANLVIGSFVAAFHDIQFVWNQFPNIIGSAAIGAANATIGAIQQMINAATGMLNGMVQSINSTLGELPGGFQIGQISNVDFGTIKNPYADALSSAVGDRNKQIEKDLNTNWIGQIGDGISTAAGKGAAALKDLAKWMDTVDKKKRKGSKSEAEKYEDVIDGAKRRIASLQAERDALGLTEQAALKLRYEQDLLNKAQARGITLTGSQRLEISNLADQMASLEYGTQKIREQMEFAKDTTRGFIDDFRAGLRNSEGVWKSFGDAALGVLDRITDKLLDDVMNALFQVNSAGSGGGGGGIFGFLGSLFGGGGAGAFPSKPGIGLYAAGTPAARPGVAWVGEKGPELVRFKGGEEVIPNHRIMTAANQNGGAGQGSSSTVTAPVSISIDATGADPEGLARVQRELAALKADLPTRVVQTVKDAQKRRVI
ncbi:phage tail length tape measure family protein [Neorhizobium sp. T6_25]|uniref:phage tail length tape measure family protein n=1 Tax=Neorhizobium sp. T6_25 TaxID=2093833 RepID=UPI000CFA17FF|nr:phage tail length tape measure family protein [Neorhizobium sp. T6_25]